LTAADAGRCRIYIPAICLIEFIYLSEKRRIDPVVPQRLLALLGIRDGSYQVAALDQAVAEAITRVNRAVVPEMADRIITATALHYGLH
jgi:hypothetical protein